MSFPVLPNSSNFLGVALVINRSRDGSRFVFHYPRHIPTGRDHRNQAEGDDVDDDEDMFLTRLSRPCKYEENNLSGLTAEELLQLDPDVHHETDSGTQVVPWEHVAGFPTKDLESILTPARAYHKKLFQLSLDPLYFVSYPICVPESGTWKRRKKTEQKAKCAKKEKDVEESAPTDTDGGNTDTRISDADLAEDENAVKPIAIRVDATATGDSKDKDKDKDKKSSMTMFNLVFILNPKKHEAKDLVDIMYTHIIKKVNKAYKYCQQRNDFVWKESKRILALKDKGREERTRMSLLWNEILSTSTLAASLQDIYEAVSQNKIAALQLGTAEGMVTPSVQIPMPFHLPDLPLESEEEHTRGLWLTTANSFVAEESLEDPAWLDKNFGLLLMEDEKKIIQELQSEPEETTLAMIEFVRHCKPTLSFHQVGQQSNNILTPGQVRKFAQHFIFWRRAMAIPPLHARDMYVVSPNCDMARLPQAAAQWARQFPLAPALPNFLAELSVAPRPYKTHCPSKAHRPAYMAMLSWLMRGGWVTQLCTFAYVVVWPEIVYEVEYALEAENLAQAKAAQDRGGEPGSLESELSAAPTSENTAQDGFGFLSLAEDSALSSDGRPSDHMSDSVVAPEQSSARDDDSGSEGSSPASSFRAETLSPSMQRSITSATSSTRPAREEPTHTEKTAEKARLARLADKKQRDLAMRATAHARKVAPWPTAHPSVNNMQHLADISPHIILDAKKATGKESLYLSAIQRRLRHDIYGHGPGPGREHEPAPEKPGASAFKGARPSAGTERDRNGHNRAPKTAGGILGPGPKKDRDGGRGMSEKEWNDRVAEAWPLFRKYFNGRSALERIALQEEMKRKDVWNLLTSMSEYLLTVRTW